MKQNIIIRKRKSVKKGLTYEYRFETASIGGQRKWISKGGFEDEQTARIEGIKALNEYNTCGQVTEPTTMSFADFLDHWLVNDCMATLSENTMINYRKKIKNLIVPYLGKYRLNTIDRDKLQNLSAVICNLSNLKVATSPASLSVSIILLQPASLVATSVTAIKCCTPIVCFSRLKIISQGKIVVISGIIIAVEHIHITIIKISVCILI